MSISTTFRLSCLACVLWTSSPVLAQELPRMETRLTGQLPGCRNVTFLGEALLGKDLWPYMVFVNSLGRVQRTEITLYDDGSQSPPFVQDLLPGRQALSFLHGRIPYMREAFRALSATIRWEVGGHVHWTTWRVPALGPDPIAWLRAWRVEMVSPQTERVVCEVP